MACGYTPPSKGGASSLDELIEMGRDLRDKAGKKMPLVVCILGSASVDNGAVMLGTEGEYQYPEAYITTRHGNLRAIKTPFILRNSAHLMWKNCNLARNWSLSYSPGYCGVTNIAYGDEDMLDNAEIGPLALFRNMKLLTQTRVKSLP